MNKDMVDFIEEKKNALTNDLEVIAATKELEVDEALQQEKVQAIAESAEIALDFKKLENCIAVMEVKVEAIKKKEALKAKATELSVQLMTDEQKRALYESHKKKVEEDIENIKKRYGI